MRKTISILIMYWLINNMMIAQNRVVLIEQFTNSGCPPCAISTPKVFEYVNKHQESVISVSYHTSYPYIDSLHLENPADANARVSYYGSFGVPYSIVDGNQYANFSSSFLSVMPKIINDRKVVKPQFAIESSSLKLTGNTLTGRFQFISLDSQTLHDDLIAHIAVIEKNVLKSSYALSPGANSEKEYGYVMRKMIPDAQGTALNHNHDTDKVELNWVLSKIKNKDELRVVVFVQNKQTREVYQSRIYQPEGSATTGIEIQETGPLIQVFPNPSSGAINVVVNSGQFVGVLKIINPLGEIVYQETIDTDAGSIKIEPDLKNGFYFINVSNEFNHWTEKILIVK